MMALVFLWTWNSFLLPLVVESNPSRYVVTVGLSTFQGAHGNNYSALAAGSMLAALPVVVVFLFSSEASCVACSRGQPLSDEWLTPGGR